MTLWRISVCLNLLEWMHVRVHVYVNVTLRSLSSHASLSKAQAIWCPLSEDFYLAFLDRTAKMQRTRTDFHRQGRATAKLLLK